MSSVLPLLNIVFPVMAVIGVGFFYGRWKKLDPRVLAELVLFLLAPAVVFDALARQEILWEELVKTGVISILIHIIPAAAALAVKRAAGMTNRSFVPSVMLMNSVSLPYPLALLAFGEEGLAYVVLLSIPNVFISFTLGIVAHGGGASMKEPLKMPALYAAIAGIVVAMAAIPVPKFILRFSHLTGRGMFPVELFTLGYRLRSIRAADFKISLSVAALRFGLGFALAWALSEAFALTGAFRAALFLMSCSPPAVLNYIFAERYGEEGSLAASIVFTGTAMSLVTIPLLLLYLGVS
ncbi:MAG: AEC family transporter [Nitrospinae bacterium]|nr:AEC family transporter [Nitrospinota bacterium]